jgi:hypothetical protein
VGGKTNGKRWISRRIWAWVRRIWPLLFLPRLLGGEELVIFEVGHSTGFFDRGSLFPFFRNLNCFKDRISVLDVLSQHPLGVEE